MQDKTQNNKTSLGTVIGAAVGAAAGAAAAVALSDEKNRKKIGQAMDDLKKNVSKKAQEAKDTTNDVKEKALTKAEQAGQKMQSTAHALRSDEKK